MALVRFYRSLTPDQKKHLAFGFFAGLAFVIVVLTIGELLS